MFDVRREKLKKLADKAGGSASLAKQYGLNPDYLYQLVNGRRNIGEKSARNLELAMGLPSKGLEIDDESPSLLPHHDTNGDENTIKLGVGQRLATVRELRGLSQKDVADRFSISKATVSAWETGRGDPGIYRLRELAKLYGVSAESILWDSAPSNEAMQIAAEFDALNPSQQSMLRAVWMAFVQQATSDGEVERKMPITQKEKVV